MTGKNKTIPQSPPRMVISVQFHESLGIVLAPYLVYENDNGGFSYFSKRLNSVTLSDHFENPGKNEKELVNILESCRDEELMRYFSKKAKTVSDFYNELTESRLKSIIIPYVQKRTDKCLRIMRDSNMPLFIKGWKKDPVRSAPVIIQKEEARVIFNFTKKTAESHYYLNLHHDGNDIYLKKEGSLVLTDSPGWILTGGNVYLLESGIEGIKLKPFFSKDYVIIPGSAEEKYFRGFVSGVMKKYEVRTTGIGFDIVTPDCIPVLNLEKDLRGKPVLMLYFIYADKKCQFNDSNRCWVDFHASEGNYRFKKIDRNKEIERQFIDKLIERGLASKDFSAFHVTGSDFRDNPGVTNASLYTLIEWLATSSDELKSLGFTIKQNFFRDDFFTGNVNLEIGINETTDWFDVHAYANFGNFQIPFIKLKNHILNGVREYKLPDGQIAILPEEWFSRYDELFVYGKAGGDNIKLDKHHFKIAGKVTEEDTQVTELFRLDAKDKLNIPDLPPGLSGILRPYQSAGFAWMYFLYRHRLGGCIADDMGLGKTLQTLTLLQKLKMENDPGSDSGETAYGKVVFEEPVTGKAIPEKPVAGEAISGETAPKKPINTNATSNATSDATTKHPVQLDLFNQSTMVPERSVRTSLIVMPLSLIHNWENEIMKFTSGLTYTKYTGANRNALSGNLDKYDIILTTYGIVRNDLEYLDKIDFFYLILDESQVIKNPEAKVSRAVRQLRARHRLVLTGTPIENSLTDLWSQLTFLNPGILGSQRFFKEEFAFPIEKLNDIEKKHRLKQMIEPFILRRTKKHVEKDLPELSEKVYYCEMEEDQKSLYESRKSEIRNQLFEKLDAGNRKDIKIDILRGLTQLRLIANHPGLVSGKDEVSGKFGEVIWNIENLMAEGHKLLIFSQFVKHLKIYREYFNRQNWKYSWLTGEVSQNRRENVISEFQNDPDNLLFLISLRAGGVGLNLTAADYVFILDPWWNPAVEQQAISRAHRIGQKRNVFSYKFITSDSIEEKILKLQQRKSLLAGDFINLNNPLKRFTDEEIIGLFE